MLLLLLLLLLLLFIVNNYSYVINGSMGFKHPQWNTRKSPVTLGSYRHEAVAKWYLSASAT